MTNNVSSLNTGASYNAYNSSLNNNNDIKLEDISVLYTTDKVEEDRTTFNETFEETSVSDSEDGKKFLEGLEENKESLRKDLGLTSEEYDGLACTAMALASQETGFGEENGYDSENKGIGKLIRGIVKKIDSIRGGKSASSGLTQMKIYDFLNGEVLNDNQKDVLKKYGIEADSVSKNNLYENPDKAAIATMVALSAISENYDDYTNKLTSEHNNLGKNLNDNLSENQRIEKGNNILNNIEDSYKNLNDDEKKELRSTFKQWLLAQNDSKASDKGVDKDYNEEIQLNKLNDILKKGSGDFQLNQSDLNYIRYTLTSDGNEMNKTEYLAYGWNKGTEGTGMQLDRMLAEKIGTILVNPEDFDYDQFTSNVENLTYKYAGQSVSDGEQVMKKAFENLG